MYTGAMTGESANIPAFYDTQLEDIIRDVPDPNRDPLKILRESIYDALPRVQAALAQGSEDGKGVVFGLLEREVGVLIPQAAFPGARLFMGTANPAFDEDTTQPSVAYLVSESWITTGKFAPQDGEIDWCLYASGQGGAESGVLTRLSPGKNVISAASFPDLKVDYPAPLSTFWLSEDQRQLVITMHREQLLVQTAHIDKRASYALVNEFRKDPMHKPQIGIHRLRAYK